MTGSEFGANEGEVTYGDVEPQDALFLGSVTHTCCGVTLTYYDDLVDALPDPDKPCPACFPCRDCGRRAIDCDCPIFDPFK